MSHAMNTVRALVASVCVTIVPAAASEGDEPRATTDLRANLLDDSSLAAALKATSSPAPIVLQAQPADAGEEEEEGGISDNSFLIEEAYNQEPGVVQHIFNWVRGWSWEGGRSRTFDFVFTQEWPIHSQTHQFSYTVPLSTVFDHPDGEPSTDVEDFDDILLNYRYQMWTETDCCPAFSPRFSLILPTGDEHEGFGTGEVGYQINLPLSKEIDDWAYHFNAGLTVTPDVEVGVAPAIDFGGRTLNGYNLGASAIWLADKDLNFLFEALALWNEELTDDGSEDHTFEVYLSPGVRWAPYTSGSTQWVLGLGLPIGLTEDSTDISLFFYMSFEHPFRECAGN